MDGRACFAADHIQVGLARIVRHATRLILGNVFLLEGRILRGSVG